VPIVEADTLEEESIMAKVVEEEVVVKVSGEEKAKKGED